MVKPNNPAGRLYKILDKAKQQPDKKSTKEVWRTAVDAGFLDEDRLLEVMAMLHQLVRETKTLVENDAELNAELHFKYFSQIETAISSDNLAAQWNSRKAQLSDAALLSLAHTAEALSKKHSEEIIGVEELINLDREISELFSEIEQAGIDPKLKEVLLDQLQAIRISISEYRISGAKGIDKSLTYVFGSILRNKELLDLPAPDGLVEKYKKIVFKAQSLVSLATSTKELGMTACRLLGLG